VNAGGRRLAWGLALAVLAAALLRFWDLGRQGFWADEMYSLNAARQSLWQVLADRDQTPPLHNLVLHFWIRVAGESELAVRVPAAVFGVTAVPLLHAVAARLYDRRVGVLAASLLALSLHHVVNARDARAYSLLVLLALASMWAYLRLLERRRAAGPAYVVLTALLLYSHLFGVFIVAAQWAYQTLPGRHPRVPAARWLQLQAGVLLLFAPWLGILAERASRVAGGFWIPAPAWHHLLDTAVLFAGSLLLLAAFAATLLAARYRGAPPMAGGVPGPGRGRAPLLVLWLVVPVALPLLLSLHTQVFTPKYAIAASVPLYVVVAAAALRLRAPWRTVAVAGLLVASAATVGLHQMAGEPEDSKEDWRAATAYVEAEAPPGALVLFNDGYCDSTTDRDWQCAFEHYGDRSDLRLVPFLQQRPVTDADLPALRRIVANETEVWLVYGYATDGHRIGDELAAQHGEPEATLFKRLRVERYH
jgi:uncharacterized membrane protein